MQSELQSELEQLGFSERQAAVYVALLRFGKTGVQPLALALGMPRASCYDALQQLVQQGLVKSMTERGQQVFVTESPDRIGTLLNLQLEEVQARRRRAELFLPRLEALLGDGTGKPRFRIVNDVRELQAIHAEYAELGRPILQLVGYDAFLALHREDVVQQNTERLQTQRSVGRAILITDLPIEPPTGSGFQVRCVPPSMVTAQGEMTVCGDRVLLFAYTDNTVAIEIISAAIANTCQATLELAWQQAGEIEKTLKGGL